MSDSPLPDYVDQRKIFIQQGVVEGFLELARLPRTREMLAGPDARVDVTLRFLIDETGRRIIRGRVSAQVMAICQRCLEPFPINLDDDIELAVLADEKALDTLEERFDPWLCTDNKIELANLVDEQLVLCMPIVNLHQNGPCLDASRRDAVSRSDEDGAASDRPNPFAILETLKKH